MPKTLLATHFHELFRPSPTNDGAYICPSHTSQLAFGHMAVHLDENATERAGQVVHLYRFTEGLSSESFGTVCAALNGVPGEVVERAIELGRVGIEEAVELVATLGEGEAAELERAEDIARAFLSVDIDAPQEVVGSSEECDWMGTLVDILDA